MPATVLEIDARQDGAVTATTIVAGLPLVVRQLRQAGRLGFARAAVACRDEAGAAAIRAALARDPVALPVELVVRAPQPGASVVVSDGCAVYGRDALAAAAAGGPLTPLVTLETPRDRARAYRALLGQITKSIELDGLVSYYVIRPVARVFTRALVDTRISPNQVTLGALACGLAAAALLALGGAGHALAAGLLYWLGGAIDHVDGDLARLRLQSSRFGEWLDSMTDEISTYALLAGLGVGLARDDHGTAWALVGVGGSVVGALTALRLYSELARRKLPIDTAQFPWFFVSGEVGARERTPLGKVIYALGFLVRRDVNVTGVAILLAGDLREVACALVAAGVAIGAALTLTHDAVVALRRRA